jgi:RNA polymerase sigma-70 factor (ECF subfamily)
MQDNGLTECLGAFYAAHKQELFTYALSITRSPACAEDAVHEAFSRILARNRPPDDLRPYVFRCVRNASLDLLRSAESERRKLDGYQVLFQKTEDSGSRELAGELLALLSDREREIAVLKIYSGLTFREIAEVCREKQGTVAAVYWQSLQKLRAKLPSITEPKEQEHEL